MADGDVNFNSDQDWFGTETVTFTASDGESTASDIIDVIVISVNDEPYLVSTISDIDLEESTEITGAFNVNDHFSDVDSELDFGVSSEANLRIEIQNDGSVDIEVIGDWSGEEDVKVSAYDEEYEVYDWFTVTRNATSTDQPDQEEGDGKEEESFLSGFLLLILILIIILVIIAAASMAVVLSRRKKKPVQPQYQYVEEEKYQKL
jgi:hypothetical protein